ncbi:hypothetical protein SKAU_G00125280 [Synaphobranchus kaupii]|uniref:Uncharacterized protein n=1 Tax=Synaphobranchus kaupii TaxID=118154 RepID=A0A9Q1FPG7_SYNKA|nr:hypothetical protein SKAU_G00125280 [Synaphobranchus kaupii]
MARACAADEGIEGGGDARRSRGTQTKPAGLPRKSRCSQLCAELRSPPYNTTSGWPGPNLQVKPGSPAHMAEPSENPIMAAAELSIAGFILFLHSGNGGGHIDAEPPHCGELPVGNASSALAEPRTTWGAAIPIPRRPGRVH